MSRHATAMLAALVAALACASCGDRTPSAPSATAVATSGTDTSAGSTAVGLSGVIRGLDPRAGAFTLVTRTGTLQVRIDAKTQIWSGGTQVRPASLKDGQVVAIRGADYGSYVLAITISVSR